MDDIAGVDDTWEPGKEGQNEVDEESRVAAGSDDDGDGGQEDCQDVETDVAGHCDCV